MGSGYLDIAREIGEPVRKWAGEDVYARFMEGSEALAAGSERGASIVFARWLEGAIEVLDELVDEHTRHRILEHHGAVCAEMNRGHTEAFLGKRRGHDSLRDFIQSEDGLSLDGNVVYITYAPRSMGGGVRCFCSFWHALPADEEISLTWCHCSKGLVMKTWEALLDRPVKADLIESCMSGGETCKFAVYLEPGELEPA